MALLCESVDEIILSNHLNETSLAAVLLGTNVFQYFIKWLIWKLGEILGVHCGGSPVWGIGMASDRNGVQIQIWYRITPQWVGERRPNGVKRRPNNVGIYAPIHVLKDDIKYYGQWMVNVYVVLLLKAVGLTTKPCFWILWSGPRGPLSKFPQRKSLWHSGHCWNDLEITKECTSKLVWNEIKMGDYRIPFPSGDGTSYPLCLSERTDPN